MRQTQNQFFGLDSAKLPYATPGTIFIAVDTRRIYVYDINREPRLVSGTATGGGGDIVTYDTYADLPTPSDPDTIAFVVNSTGIKWLPGSLGGTYYPAGWYIYQNGVWTSIEAPVDEALQLVTEHIADLNNPHQVDKTDVGLSNVDNTADLDKPISDATVAALLLKSDVSHNHVKSDIADFNELDYASAAQGLLANTSLQPGDNISELFNDEIYLQPSDNVSALTNDSGYIEGNTMTSYRSDINDPDNYLYTGYLLNGTPVIKRYLDGIEAFAQGVTNLETDWTNRLNLTYI